MKKCDKCGSFSLSKHGSMRGKKRYICNECGRTTVQPVEVEVKKKKGVYNWKDAIKVIEQHKELKKRASFSQDIVPVNINTDLDKIIIAPISDIHLGSFGTDYRIFEEFTDLLLNKDNFFTILLGDINDNFVNFHNKMAMFSQVISPEEQELFLISWLKDVRDKILFACWGNHDYMDEKHVGKNSIKRILSKHTAYIDGIGKSTININNKVKYDLVVTHKTRYWSSLNKTHGLKKMSREQVPYGDVYIAGDRHEPEFDYAYEGGEWKLFIQLGTLKVEDTYAKRHFNLYTSPIMPCFVLDTKEKMITPFKTWEEAIRFAGAS